MSPTFSIIVPTTGRPTLVRALQSLANQPLTSGDEVLVIGPGALVREMVESFGHTHLDCTNGGDFGCVERTLGIARARGTHLAFLDDDDAYLPGAIAAMRARVAQQPDRPVMFKMIAQTGLVLWRDPVVRYGNHGSPQFVTPNDPARLGQWTTRYEGDLDFCVSTLALHPPQSLIWDSTIVCACRTFADRVWEAVPCA